MFNNREAAYSLLRITFGVIFLFSGIGKLFGGVGNFVAGMEKGFTGKLPLALVTPFSYVLPYAEVAIGALLVFGLFTSIGLVLSGLLMVALTFGTVMEGEFQIAAHNTQYGLVNFVLLWFVEFNGYSVDRLLRKQTTFVQPEDRLQSD